MEVPDKIIEGILESVSNVLLEETIPKKSKKLRKNLIKYYNKLLAVADSVYEHDFPFFDLKSDG